ncbi:hypothetical protein A3C31_02450 [Candidatus Roizmanbacteria bacterium RIFCSPHIGHO2_02_FULL_40_53]|nr:MAG: hypothetical protein A3C31_02450 [Candidatus Roizmanbacteria bacterium RIFCSPHIGHO2_02_FULL_40_53]
MKKNKKDFLAAIKFMLPFLFMSFVTYSIPLFLDIELMESLLFYILGAIYQLTALAVGFLFLLYKKKEKRNL